MKYTWHRWWRRFSEIFSDKLVEVCCTPQEVCLQVYRNYADIWFVYTILSLVAETWWPITAAAAVLWLHGWLKYRMIKQGISRMPPGPFPWPVEKNENAPM